MKKITPNPPATLFSINESANTETLLIQASETLASLDAIITDLAFELEGVHRQKLLGSQQLVVLGTLFIERLLAILVPINNAKASSQ
ncbi:DUF6124 family protein [Pseudomonas sp. ICMP 460]|uniref:DUF6124 family protein n=1 Tax=Pseudomonas TaxID=286 RepID=UPI000C07AD85|nr:DUF6124 family protein [Pseudomonas sp. ICMP 460]PHN29459.1 hypothetical protein AO240_20770 [Pseudomonas sp. ICMP 460]